jgi:nucleoside-triphosphatase THEP1
MNVSDAKELILSEQRVFLTGKAGTGKSTLLKDIVETI